MLAVYKAHTVQSQMTEAEMEFIIEYVVKPEKAEEAEALRSRFFAGLKDQPDPEITYRSLAKPDGVSFVHLGSFADQDALGRFQSTPHFKKFSSRRFNVKLRSSYDRDIRNGKRL